MRRESPAELGVPAIAVYGFEDDPLASGTVSLLPEETRKLLAEFAEDTPWVHLDIAGTSWSNEEKPYLAMGPTGVAVRTLVHLLTHLDG